MKRTLSVIFMALFCLTAKAQDSFEIYPSLDIRPIMNLKVIDLTNNGLNFNFASIEDYQNGIISNSAFEVSVKSNQNWRLTIAASDPFLIPTSNGASNNIPSSIFGLSKSSAGNFINLSTTQTEIANGNRGSTSRPGNLFNLDLSCNPGFNYSGLGYMCEVIFTITAD